MSTPISIYSLLMKAPAGIAIYHGPELHIEFMNTAFAGCSSKTSPIGKTFDEAFPNLMDSEFRKHFSLVYQTGTEFSVREFPIQVCGDKNERARYFDILIQPTYSEDRKIDGLIAYTFEVTDKVLARTRAKENENYFSWLTDTAPAIIWVTRADGQCTYLSKLWYTYTGTSPDSGLGIGWTESVHPEYRQKAFESFSLANSGHEIFSIFYKLRRNDGTYRWVLDTGNPCFDSNRTFVGYVGTVIDIHDKLQAEEALQAAISIREEFLGIASHELRTPITSLRMQLELTNREIDPLQSDFPESNVTSSRTFHRLKKFIAMSLVQVDRITTLIEDMLDVSRIQAGKLSLYRTRTDLLDLINEILERFSEQLVNARCPVQIQIPSGLIGNWDRIRIEQVVVNLLTNAMKYAPASEIYIDATKEDNQVELIVRDTGPGIPFEKQSTIFDKFERATTSRTVSGLGLGLYISKQIIEAHGGSISARNKKGATFVIRLPLG